MTSRRHMTLVAAAATLMAAAPISSIFDSLGWLVRALIAVAMVSGAALGVRTMRGRLWLQVLAMAGALLVALTMFFGGGTAFMGLIPTPATFAHFGQLLGTAGTDIQTAYVPVDHDIDSLLFLTTLGIGGVAVLVDLLAVGLRRPALTGLPMLAIYSVPVAVYTDSVNPIPFVIGAAGYMWLLVSDNVDKVRRFGRRFTGEGRGVDLWEPSPLAATGRRLAVAGVIVAVLLPIMVPGMTSGLISRFGPPGGQGSGPGANGSRGSVDLFANLHGKLMLKEEVDMIKVSTNDPSPYYMRFGVADDVQAGGFKHRAPSGKLVSGSLGLAYGFERQAANPRYSANVEILKNYDMPLLPIYSIPTGTGGLDAGWSYDMQQQVVYSPRSRSPGKRYTVEFVRPVYEPERLRAAQPLPENNPTQRDFTQVPDIQAVQNRVDELIAGKTTNYDKVRALYDFFSTKNNFVYDTATKSGTTGQDITDFLDGRRGFCEQYAAALTWMVRAAGIPARVAFGFTKGRYSGGVYTMTNRNLHAWTEVYFEGFGWVPFDATPSTSVAGSVPTTWAPNVDAPQEQETGSTSNPSPGPAASAGPNDNSDRNPLECNEVDCPEAVSPIDTPTPMWVWWTTAGAIVALILLLMPALRRQALRRKRSRGSGIQVKPIAVADGAPAMMVVEDGSAARRDAHAAWDELMDSMADYRISIDPAETPRTTAERLILAERLPTSAADQARLLGRAEERARYSQRPAPTEGLLTAVREVRKVFASQAGKWVRFTAVAFPPSVTQRWRASSSSAAAKFSERMSDIRTAFLRPLRPLRALRPLRRTSH